MKKYDVTITEYLEKVISVEAENAQQAEEIACSKWMRGEVVLGADEFTKIEYHAEEQIKNRKRER